MAHMKYCHNCPKRISHSNPAAGVCWICGKKFLCSACWRDYKRGRYVIDVAALCLSCMNDLDDYKYDVWELTHGSYGYGD